MIQIFLYQYIFSFWWKYKILLAQCMMAFVHKPLVFVSFCTIFQTILYDTIILTSLKVYILTIYSTTCYCSNTFKLISNILHLKLSKNFLCCFFSDLHRSCGEKSFVQIRRPSWEWTLWSQIRWICALIANICCKSFLMRNEHCIVN